MVGREEGKKYLVFIYKRQASSDAVTKREAPAGSVTGFFCCKGRRSPSRRPRIAELHIYFHQGQWGTAIKAMFDGCALLQIRNIEISRMWNTVYPYDWEGRN
jgi:hypothetical protein